LRDIILFFVIAILLEVLSPIIIAPVAAVADVSLISLIYKGPVKVSDHVLSPRQNFLVVPEVES
jgi:hypothetical protein